MITLFSTPKPFHGHVGVIQRNAVQSWASLRPRPEILLLGDDEGTAEVAREFGAKHIPDVARNERGTPLVNSVFEQAERAASHPILAYTNADIMYTPAFVQAVRRVPFRRFLMVGRRTNLDLDRPWDFAAPDWHERLRDDARARGVLFDANGIDYFVFTKGLWPEIPPFALGRTVWDLWLIRGAMARGAPVVDATADVLAVHQNHDYGHVRGGVDEVWKGQEATQNSQFGGEHYALYTTEAAGWLLKNGRIVPALTRRHLSARWKRHLHANPRLHNWLVMGQQGLRAPHRVPPALVRHLRRSLAADRPSA